MVAINRAFRQLSCVLLVGLVVPALCAQDAPGSANVASSGLALNAVASLSGNPPKAPRVTCNGGQLKISADNSTLGSILAAVHACTGVQIDIPAGSGGSRTFEELGPGPEREVLESLLSGTDFNYVIGSSDADPQKIETVLLMERTKEVALNGAPPDRTLTAARRAWLASRQNLRRAGTSGEESPQAADEPAEAPAVADEATASPATAENATASAAQAPAADAAPSAAADAPVPPAPQESILAAPAVSSEASSASSVTNPALDSGKSTSQRITDMQQLFEQRRQMTQSQNPSVTQQPVRP